jgi:hypothetical protein
MRGGKASNQGKEDMGAQKLPHLLLARGMSIFQIRFFLLFFRTDDRAVSIKK